MLDTQDKLTVNPHSLRHYTNNIKYSHERAPEIPSRRNRIQEVQKTKLLALWSALPTSLEVAFLIARSWALVRVPPVWVPGAGFPTPRTRPPLPPTMELLIIVIRLKATTVHCMSTLTAIPWTASRMCSSLLPTMVLRIVVMGLNAAVSRLSNRSATAPGSSFLSWGAGMTKLWFQRLWTYVFAAVGQPCVCRSFMILENSTLESTAAEINSQKWSVQQFRGEIRCGQWIEQWGKW